MKVNLSKILFVLLILSVVSAKIELSFAMVAVAFVLGFRSKLDSHVGILVMLMSGIFLIGMLGVFHVPFGWGTFVKDVIYYLRPILLIVTGYMLISRIENKKFLFQAFIVLGFLSAIWHLFNIATGIGEIDSVVRLRTIGGRYNHIELVALIFLTLVKNIGLRKNFGPLTYKLLIGVLILSFILYFSRVMIVIYIVFALAYRGYLKVSAKGLKAGVTGILSLVAFMLLINQFDVDSNSKGIKGFIFKIQNSYEEIFESLEIKNIKKDKRELWKHWRGYEAESAINQLNDKGVWGWTFGDGFGSMVDLGVEVELAGEETRYIPLLHNGYVYVLFKTGLTGLFLYIIIFFYLHHFYKARSDSEIDLILNRLLVGCAFYFAISSLVISGIFKPYDFSILLTGSLLAVKKYYREDWNLGDSGNS